MPSSLARFSLGSNAKLTVMILERNWNKERERKTNYKEEEKKMYMNCWVYNSGFAWWRFWLLSNWERMRETGKIEREWRGPFFVFGSLVCEAGTDLREKTPNKHPYSVNKL